MIFSPENSSLRIFKEEGQIQPLGIHGEGLLKRGIGAPSDQSDDDIEQTKIKSYT